MTPRGQFSVHEVRGVTVVEVAGDVDMTNAHELEGSLERAARTDRGTVVVSLKGDAYFDSKGVRTLLTAAERLQTVRQRLLIAAPFGTIVRRVLEIAGVPRALPVFESLEQALASLNNRP